VRINVYRILVLLALGAQTLMAANVTYVVGTCRPGLPSYPTISSALAGSPAPNVVFVCPGTYNEQIAITQPVTLKGVATGDSAQAVIAVPSGGLAVNATSSHGQPVAAQVWVNNVAGDVNISDVTIDGAGNSVSFTTGLAGIFYQNTSGTVSNVVVRNELGSAFGTGVWFEGGTATPSVAVENSSIHDFEGQGVILESGNSSPTSALAASVKGNAISCISNDVYCEGVLAYQGATVTAAGNTVSGGPIGIIFSVNSAGSISGNTIVGSSTGIYAYTDGVTVQGNRIVNASTGVIAYTAVSPVEGNSIFNSTQGIDFRCYANPNVHSNQIDDAGVGLLNVPDSVATTNNYLNVGTIRTGGC
jgi:hypothetical protein